MMHTRIGEIARESKLITPSSKCEEVYTLFNQCPGLEGIVVCEHEQPIGLVMKTHFFQKLSTKFGFDLFMNRTIDLAMDRELLIVDYDVDITEVSRVAMDRKLANLYDFVIVTKNHKMYGVVSIRELLIKLSEIQINIARNSNPLSGLPGNHVIEDTLQNVLSYPTYSVLYLDIDNFKAFNDTYGFKEGDEVIKETAKMITETIHTPENEPSFVGHIGGDDFIAAIPHYNYEALCKTIITRFDDYLNEIFLKEEYQPGLVLSIDRQGYLIEDSPIVSISIAVVQNKNVLISSVEEISKIAAKIKKRCKSIKGSQYLTLEDI